MLWIQLGLFVILMGFSAFFSSAETSLFSLNRTQLEQMRRNSNPRVELVERLLSEPRRLIVTILIGNEFVNVAASVISAAIVIGLLGAQNKLINLFIMIPILLLVGEITPKTLAIRNNIAFATFQSVPIDLFAQGTTPLRRAVRLLADWITTRFIGKERSPGSIVTEDMVRTLAHEAVGEGTLDQAEAQYIDHIFDFGNKTVGEVMTPRSHILSFSKDMPPQEMISMLRRTRHTKVPVYSGQRDYIIGILYARDLLGVDLKRLSEKPKRLQRLLRRPYFVPESKPASDLFLALRKRRQSLALALDEYGGVTGLVTMENLLECIFGDIRSPSELLDQPAYQGLPDGSMRFEADLPIEEFNEAFGAQLSHESAKTIGGLVLERFGELPVESSSILVDDMGFTVLAIKHNRIQRLSVKRLDADRDEVQQDRPGDGTEQAVSSGDGERIPNPAEQDPPPKGAGS
jgi:CBS domain containing-hemolysin-like protein